MKAGSRIRSVKPEWLDDERLAACSDGARVLSIALIVLADDWGCGRANATWLAGIAWTYHEDPDQPRKVAAFLRELETIGYIRTYIVRSQSYFEIVNWRKHQRCDNAGKRRVPGPDESSGGSAPPATSANEASSSDSRGENPRIAAPRAPAPASRSVSDSDSVSDSEIPADDPADDKPRIPGAYRLVEQRLRSELKKVGIIHKDLTGRHWSVVVNAILDFLDAHPARRSDEVVVSLVRGFKANAKAAEKGWPLSYLAQNILEYLDKAKGPVSREELEAAGGTKAMAWNELTGEAPSGGSGRRSDDEVDDG